MQKNMIVKYIKPVLLVLFTVAITLLISNSFTEDEKAKTAFEQHYKIYSVDLPGQLNFAGENIPLENADLAERYDRELLTNIYWQSQTLMFIKRAQKYFPTIEAILKAQNIPDDFKYLAIAESGLQPNVVSPSNAASYWQFLDKTGKIFGLEITEEVDERYHLEKATVAACNYFKTAYAQLGSWPLVAASYNMGIEGVKRQIQHQGVNNYFDLYLNTETSRYLFRIMAIKTIVQNPEKYGFYIPRQQFYAATPTVKIKVDKSINDLAKYVLENNSNYKWLKLMNPWLRKPSLKVTDGKVYYIALPKEQIVKNDYARHIVNDTIELAQTHFSAQ